MFSKFNSKAKNGMLFRILNVDRIKVENIVHDWNWNLHFPCSHGCEEVALPPWSVRRQSWKSDVQCQPNIWFIAHSNSKSQTRWVVHTIMPSADYSALKKIQVGQQIATATAKWQKENSFSSTRPCLSMKLLVRISQPYEHVACSFGSLWSPGRFCM